MIFLSKPSTRLPLPVHSALLQHLDHTHVTAFSQICRGLGANQNLHMPLQLPTVHEFVLAWWLASSLASVIELDAKTHAGCLAALSSPNWST